MTPRPDIVAIRDDATIGELRALFREQEYSRFPVYKDSLDNIAGFVFVKDLVAAEHAPTMRGRSPVCCGRRVFVPETKRVPELLKQFQRQQTQSRDRGRRVRRHGRPGDDRGPARGDRRRDSRRVRRRDRSRSSTRATAGSCSAARSTSTRWCSGSTSQIEREGFETVGGFLLSHLGPGAGGRREASRSTGCTSRCSKPNAGGSTRRSRIARRRGDRGRADEARTRRHESPASSRSSAARTPASPRC